MTKIIGLCYYNLVIKAIIFDVDGVLVDSKNANVAFFQNILRQAGYVPNSRKEILECFHLPLWQALEKLTGSNNPNEIRRIWDMAEDPKIRQPKLLIYPESLEYVLELLNKKYRLAIVTSRIKVGIDEIFGSREIKHLFSAVVTFEDYEHPKPHPEPLLVALAKLDLSAEEAIYVGDSMVDIEAAQAAGMKSIYLTKSPSYGASINIGQFDEIPGAVDKLTNLK